jgi:hypothetical protein
LGFGSGQKNWVWGLGLDPKPNPKPNPKPTKGLTNSEFISIHFGVEIQKKIHECQKFFWSKIFKKNYKKICLRNLKIF